MSRLLLPSLFAVALVADSPLKTEYRSETTYAVTVDSTFAMETTDFSMERDGVPVESQFGGEMSSTQTRQIVMMDTVLEVQEGSPTQMHRAFDTITSNSVRMRGDDEMESDLDCPLQGVTLELTSDGTDVSVEVVDGTAPDDDALLTGHHMAWALDALYPEDEVAAGESWEISGESMVRALAFDQEKAFFPAPQREEAGERGERGGGGGRGRGGRGGGRGAESAARYFQAATWDLEGTLAEAKEERDGVEYYVVNIKGEATGELPERERGGRDRQDRNLTAPSAASTAVENSFSMELEATLLLSVEGKHPASFELEASLTTSSTREMQRRESSMSIHTENAGKLEYNVTIEPVVKDEESE